MRILCIRPNFDPPMRPNLPSVVRRLLAGWAVWLLAGGAHDAAAAHALGGEMIYEYLGSNQYRITVYFYRECFTNAVEPPGWQQGGTNLDPSIQVGIFEGNGLETQITLPLTESSITPVETVLENPCGTLPPNLCMQRLRYSAVVTLAPSSVGYDVVFQRCCRNPGIQNIQNPDDIGITLTTQIPPNTGDANPNSSPVFNTIPPAAICANFDFFLNQSATDADGDQLVYSLCNPLQGGTPNDPSPAPSPASTFVDVPWSGAFSATDPMPANPNMAIDPVTGQITGFPTAVGAYVMGICVSEYRDGVLISTVMRDFQFNVVNCSPVIVSAVTPQTAQQLCVGETLSFTEQSIGAQSYLWDFGVAGMSSDISTSESPSYTYPDTGTYVVTLIVNPTWPCADTTSTTFYVYEPIQPSIEVSNFQCSEGLEYFQLTANGAFNAATDLLWTLPGGSVGAASTLSTGWVHFNNANTWSVDLQASHFGCSAETDFAWTAPPEPFADIADQTSFCQGFTFDFENLSSNAESFSWDFGVAGSSADVSTLTSPSYTYPADGVYTVRLIAGAPYTCPDTAFATVEIFPLIDPLFTAPVPDCFSTHAFDFQVVASNIPETQYVWDFGGPVDDVNIQGGTVVNLHYAEPGTYAVTVTASANGCDVSHTETVWAIADPTIGFTGGPVSGCPPHPVSFTNLSTTETATSYLWHFGDGSTSPAASPSYVYTTSGNFSVTLEMTTGGFCPRNLVLEMPGFIDILPVPQAGFDIEPNEVDLLNPVVTVTSLAEEGVECFYYFGDGGSLAACDGIYTYTDGGLFDVTQTVVNAAGCTSTAVGQVAVNGTIFYAPNAFSPNNDGMNDVWLPVALGTEGYRVEIFDRWGERIWSADQPGIPWLGSVGDGTHYVPDGVYFWKVWLQDQVLQPQTHSGTLQVIR